MASPFSLSNKGGVGREEYAKLIARETKRFHGDRDRAVRSANIAGGFGSSTAQRYLHGGGGGAKAGGGGGGGKAAGGGGKTSPQKTASVSKAKPQTTFSPDLAVSPPRGDMMWPGATAGPPNPFSPDLAVSPPRGDTMWQGATAGSPNPFSPDLAVSPPRGGAMWPGATESGTSPQRPFDADWQGRTQPGPAGSGPPSNANMSMASILRTLPPELIARLVQSRAPQPLVSPGGPTSPVSGSGGIVGAGRPLISF